MDLKKYLDEFKNKRIVVIGDVMLDEYLFCKVDRISPEAPIAIASVQETTYVPGGAANTANNLVSLGAESYLIGIVGNDDAKDSFFKVTNEEGINTQGITISEEKKTTKKTRILGKNQQLLRLDDECTNYIDKKLQEELMNNLKNIGDVDSIIISDYLKGTMAENFCRKIKNYSLENNIPLLVDTKPDHKEFYRGASLITPNKEEAGEMVGKKIKNLEDIKQAGKNLQRDLKCNVIITAGSEGMYVFENEKVFAHIPTVAKEVYDVSGAGDTVIATLGLALSSGASLKEAAILANYAAGIKVGKVGTATVALSELNQSLENLVKDE